MFTYVNRSELPEDKEDKEEKEEDKTFLYLMFTSCQPVWVTSGQRRQTTLGLDFNFLTTTMGYLRTKKTNRPCTGF